MESSILTARIIHEMLFYIVILIGARSLMYYCTNEQVSVSVREAAPFPKTLNEKVLSQLGVEYSIQPESIF